MACKQAYALHYNQDEDFNSIYQDIFLGVNSTYEEYKYILNFVDYIQIISWKVDERVLNDIIFDKDYQPISFEPPPPRF